MKYVINVRSFDQQGCLPHLERWRELVELKWSDIDFDNRTLLNILFDGQISIKGEMSINLVYVADIIIPVLMTAVIVEIFYMMKREDKYK